MPVTSARPRPVTITLWGVFLLGVWNMGRVVAIGQQISLLTELNSSIDPRLRLVVALIWACVWWGTMVALWRRYPFVRRGIPIILLLYAVYEVSLTIIFAQAQPARSSWLLNSLFYLTAILFSYWALRRTAVTSYFEKERFEIGN